MSQEIKTVAEVMLDVLYENGVSHVFGIPGENSIPIYDALTRHSIKLILTRHEQGATHMADGYARASGKPGLVCVTSGPGATNTLTGLLTAMMDSIPVIVITGQSATPDIGLDAFQEADIMGCLIQLSNILTLYATPNIFRGLSGRHCILPHQTPWSGTY